MSEKDIANLEACLDSIRKIRQFVQGITNADEFFENEIVFDATLMNFVVLGEAAGKISEETTQFSKDIPWRKIRGLRNIIAHAYFGVDAEEIWQIIHNDLPDLEIRFRVLLTGN